MKRVGTVKMLAVMGAMMLGGWAARDAQAAQVIFANFHETGDPALHYYNSGIVVNSQQENLVGLNVTGKLDDQGSGILGGFNGDVLFDLLAVRAGDATASGINVSQPINGTLSFRSGTTNVLTMTFTGAILSGFTTTGNINGSTLAGHAIAFSSDLQTTFTAPLSFSIALSTEQTMTLGANNNLADFNASAAGNFTETVGGGAGNGAPLPAAVWGGMGLMGLVGGIGGWVRRRRA